jgi:mono/diheme cytochrome c family protein
MKTKYQNILAKLTLAIVVVSVYSCKEKNGLAPEYMPDMYRSPAIEPYVDYGDLKDRTNEELANKMSVRMPVEGSIPRGFTPYGYENTADGYILAGENLKNPIEFTDAIGKEGKELYGMFCASCHGNTGQGDGILVEREKFPPLPVKFKEGLDISEGKMFHSITYGKGLMGSHSSQLNQEERWKLVHYIRTEFMKENPNKVVEVVAQEVEPIQE